MTSAGRIMALDVGDRRIGVALSDPLGLTAQPLLTLHRSTLHHDLKSLSRLIRRHSIATVLVGLPLHADGTPSPQSIKTEAFAARLRELHPELFHLFLDERHTTADAHHLLDNAGYAPRQAGRSHGRVVDRRERIDQIAATLLLQSFLSIANPPLLPEPQ